MKRKLENALILVLLLSGLVLMLYPTVAQWWNARHESQIVDNYRETVDAMEEERREAMWEAAQAYNDTHALQPLILPESQEEEYENTLDVTGTGIMGYLVIPKIDVNLAIYHGTGDDVLQVGVGHLSGSSLPVGGRGTHCVLSGHRGIPSARLLTDLPKLEIGDEFSLVVLGKTLTYRVDQILTVLPTEGEALAIDPEQDLCTLVTCTPYGINSHRLLVRGVRVEDTQSEEPSEETAEVLEESDLTPIYAGIGLMLVVALLVSCIRRRRNET
jgi:sortase A